jgi:hypothetical protein
VNPSAIPQGISPSCFSHLGSLTADALYLVDHTGAGNAALRGGGIGLETDGGIARITVLPSPLAPPTSTLSPLRMLLAPDTVTEPPENVFDMLPLVTVTVPGTVGIGKYALRAVRHFKVGHAVGDGHLARSGRGNGMDRIARART